MTSDTSHRSDQGTTKVKCIFGIFGIVDESDFCSFPQYFFTIHFTQFRLVVIGPG